MQLDYAAARGPISTPSGRENVKRGSANAPASARLALSLPNARFSTSSHSCLLMRPQTKSPRPVQYTAPCSGVSSSARRSLSSTRLVRFAGGAAGAGRRDGSDGICRGAGTGEGARETAFESMASSSAQLGVSKQA